MTDYTLYKELYLKCFLDDSEEDAEMLFKTVLSKAILVAEYEENRPIAMLYLMESDLVSKNKSYPFYYLYAACTHPDFRGKGIMQKLLKKAKEIAVENNKIGIFLKPANEPLFDFYQKSDFSPLFRVLKLNDTAENFLSKLETLNLLNPVSIIEIPMSEWANKRKPILGDITDLYADFSKDLFAAATDGCKAVYTNSGASAVYETRGNTLLIKEALCYESNQTELLNLAYQLIKLTGCEYIELRAPESLNCTLFEELGAKITRFSVLWCYGDFSAEDFSTPYHGFAFD